MNNPPPLLPTIPLPQGGELNLQTLAFDLASELLEPQTILEKHSLTKTLLRKITANRGFRALVQEHRQYWNSEDAGPRRVQIKSRMAQEEVLVDLVAIVKSEHVDPQARVAAAREIRNASDAGHPDKEIARAVAAAQGRLGGVGGNEGINLTINLNGTPVDLSFDQQPEPLEVEDTSVSSTRLEHNPPSQEPDDERYTRTQNPA